MALSAAGWPPAMHGTQPPRLLHQRPTQHVLVEPGAQLNIPSFSQSAAHFLCSLQCVLQHWDG